jgi:hypothetical protein
MTRKSDPKQSLLILTVGTGTDGKHSDVAAGLARTIDMVAPRLFWLAPSQSPLSLPVADLIRESIKKGPEFAPWSAAELYHAIPDPDDIHQCRQVLQEIIAAARGRLRPGERLIINPTGGTKQMSAGATLAALAEGVGEIIFTTGQRHQGIVKTGSEEIRAFSTATFFLERDMAQAAQLFSAGAFLAAARLLQGHSSNTAMIARETALCLHEWQRLNYEKAASHAARFSESARAHLDQLANADEFGALRLGDLLAGAEQLRLWGDYEEALARYYRAAEQSAKVRLAEAFQMRPPYKLAAFAQILPPGSESLKELSRSARRGIVLLAAQRAWNILDACHDHMAADYQRDEALQKALWSRHETLYGHGGQPALESQVRCVADRLRKLLETHLPAAATGWSASRRPSFPIQ